MYRPKSFREDRIEVLHDLIREVGAGILVGNGPERIEASHVPFELDPNASRHGVLRCHLARRNFAVDAIERSREVLVIFQGPQAYISPSWFPSKKQTEKVVPTWNYVVVHAYGRATTYRDPVRLRAHLAAMTQGFERSFPEPWGIDDAPEQFVEGLLRAIVGVEIEITRIEGKWKLSQNQSRDDQLGIAKGLRARGGDDDRQLADLIEEE